MVETMKGAAEALVASFSGAADAWAMDDMVIVRLREGVVLRDAWPLLVTAYRLSAGAGHMIEVAIMEFGTGRMIDPYCAWRDGEGGRHEPSAIVPAPNMAWLGKALYVPRLPDPPPHAAARLLR